MMKLLKQLLLFGIVFFITLLICELFFRTSHLAEVSNTEFYPDRGRGKRANFKYLMFNEGFGIGRYNEYAYLGEARPPEKPDNTIRVILLGDSFIESWQVFERHQFSSLAEKMLNKKYPGKNIELLNFGHSNLDLADQYAYYTQFAKNFNPDYTLFLLADYNLDPRYLDPLRPNPVIEKDSLILESNYPAANLDLYQKTKVLTQNSSLLHTLNICRKKAAGGNYAPILLDKVYHWIKPPTISTPEETEEYTVHPVSAKIIESLDPTEVIFVNRTIEGLPDKFKALCLQKGFRYYDMQEALQEVKEAGHDPYEWKVTNKSGHWNHKGHEVVAQEVVTYLSEVIETDENTRGGDLK